MKVDLLIENAQKERLPPLQQKVLKYLEEHADEVFEYRDHELTREVGGKPSSVGFSLWALHKRGLIDKDTVNGKVYFGSHKALGKLRGGLDMTQREAFEEAVRNAGRIRERVGNVGSLEILEELRSSRG
jgi:hypothetical protein